MNEYTETILPVSQQSIDLVNSVYDADGKPIFYTSSHNEVAPFPWMTFLGEGGEILLSSIVTAQGVTIDTIEHNVDIVSIDAFGMQMIESSAILQGAAGSSDRVEWTKLPAELEWLYGERPYIKASDLTSVVGPLRDAMSTGDASSDLVSFIETHTYRSPVSSANYRSYGAYYDNSMVHYVRRSTVNMKLGLETVSEVSDISVSRTDDEIQLAGNTANVVELTLQRRIGTHQALYTLVIYAESPPEYIYLGGGGTGLEEAQLESKASFQIILDKLYSDTRQLPVWCEKDSFSAERVAPIWVLVSGGGNVPAEPVLLLRTEGGVLTKNGVTAVLSMNRIYLDGDSAQTDQVTNEEIYAEYHLVAIR